MSIDADIARLKARDFDWAIPWDAVELIARAEACELAAYLCPAGVWTIGWGETAGGSVRKGMRWTPDEADARFVRQIEAYAERVALLVNPETTGPNELGAMVSLAYNIGLGAFEKSSVRRLHNAGDEASASRAFGLCDKARDPVTKRLRPLPGLTRRRAAEAALYLRAEPETRHDRMPQAVAPESKLTASPIAQGTSGLGVLAAAGGIVPALEPVSAQVRELSGTAATVKALVAQVQDFLGFPPSILLAVVGVGLAAWVLKWRREQRRQGRA